MMHDTRTRSPRSHVLHADADLLDRADCLMAEDATVGDRRDIALQDVKVRAADGGCVHPHDGIGVVDQNRLRNLFPSLLARTVVHECVHEDSLVRVDDRWMKWVRPGRCGERRSWGRPRSRRP